MGLEIVYYIKSNLRSMYPRYRFEVTNSQDGTIYTISVFKNTSLLSTTTAKNITPRDIFWTDIKNWMKSIIGKYR